MYQATRSGALWRLVARLERQGVDRWRLANAPHLSMVDALGLKAITVYTTVERKRGGNIKVTVCVMGRREHDSDCWYFHLQKRRFGGYEVVKEA